MPYDLVPKTFDAQDLTVSPFDDVHFDPQNGPMQSDPSDPVEAQIIGAGDRHVRSQPRGATWDLHVLMSATEETNRTAMLRVFSRERGLVYLTADDGAGTPVRWRVQCSVIGVDRRAANHYIVRLRVPDTRWEENTATTTLATNASGNSAAMSNVDNAGDRRTRPIFTIKADTVKTYDPADDFGLVERGFFVNRAPFPLDGWPVDVTGYQDGTGDPYATNGAPYIRDTSISNQINQVGGITAAATSIPIDTPVGGGLPAGPGFAMIRPNSGATEEQIYYATGGGGVSPLGGVIRGIGGTTAQTHPDNAVIAKSQMLKDGSDMRVFVDGQEVERFFGALDSAATRVWINASAPKRLKLTLKGAITATVPASAGEVQFNEDVSVCPESGMFVIDLEIFSYTGRDLKNRRLTGIERGVWMTTAATHADAAGAYFHPRLFVTAWGRHGLGPAPSPIERRPCIQLPTSTNKKFRWGDGADDADTVFYDATRPNRTAQWRPSFETPAGDLNDAPALIMWTHTTKVGWRPADPEAGKPQSDRLSIFLPAGMTVTAPGGEYDFQPRKEIRLRTLGRDVNGFETKLQDNYDFAEVAVVSKDFLPIAIMHEITLNGVRAATTGQTRDEVTDSVATAALPGNYLAGKFLLSHDTKIESLHLKLAKAAGGDTFDFEVWLTLDAPGPSTAKIVARFQRWSSDNYVFDGTPFPASGLTTSQVEYQFKPTATIPYIYLPPGTYYVYLRVRGGAGSLKVSETENPNTPNSETVLNATVRGGALFFRLIHPDGGPVQVESMQGGQEASFDKVSIDLDANTPQYPLVHRATPESLYHANGRLTNSANSLLFDLDFWLELGKVLTVDCEKHTAFYTDGQWTWRCPGAVKPADAADWFALEPGDNDLTWTEQNMQNTDLTLEHRGRRA